jgi:uncharacterized protein YrrD
VLAWMRPGCLLASGEIEAYHVELGLFACLSSSKKKMQSTTGVGVEKGSRSWLLAFVLSSVTRTRFPGLRTRVPSESGAI